MKNRIYGFAIGITVGLILSILSIFTISYTAAITIPNTIKTISDQSVAGMFLWDFIVVQFLDVGVAALILTYLSVKFLPGCKYYKAFGIIVGALALAYSMVPEALTSINPLHHLHEIMLILCVITAMLLVQKDKNSPSNKAQNKNT